ncbi:MAG: hypothetical protein GXP27_02710, partial [Planctomycetes bacterium]|nr:hypothetical protein [Planctomycetota bacterium]
AAIGQSRFDRQSLKTAIFQTGWTRFDQLARKKRHGEAAELARELLRVFPEHDELNGVVRRETLAMHLNAAEENQRQQLFQKAVQELDQALRFASDDQVRCQVLLRRVAVLRDWARNCSERDAAVKHLDEAWKDAEKVLAIAPDPGLVRRVRAQIALERGRLFRTEQPPLRAVDEFLRALREDPSAASARQELAEIESEFSALGGNYFQEAQQKENSEAEADQVNRTYRRAIEALGVAVRAAEGLSGPERLARHRFLRGLARSRLAPPDCEGAVEDLESFLKLTEPEGARRPPDKRASPSDKERPSAGASPFRALAYSRLAWILATCHNDAVRDGQKAVEYAREACQLLQPLFDARPDDETAFTNYVNAQKALAAAYAESGDFDRAVKVTRFLLALLEENSLEWKQQRALLELYQQSKPLREGQEP